MVLRARGFRTAQAGSAAETRQLLAKQRFDLAIVDGVLPDVQTTEWLEQLRTEWPALSVVFISAYWRDSQTYVRLTREVGVALVAYKPLDLATFVDRVCALVKNPDAKFARGPLAARAQTEMVGANTAARKGELSGTFSGAMAASPAPAAKLNTLEVTVAELSREYAQNLEHKLETLTRAVLRARAEPSALPEALRLAHQLKGAAGTFGLAAVSAAAAELEDLLHEAEECSDAPRRNFAPDVDRALESVRRSGASAREAFTTRETAVSPEVTAQPRRTILVCDDDPEFCRVVSFYAREQLLEVELAPSKEQALERVRASRLAGAIIDANLGTQGDGFALVRELRALAGTRHVPIAVVSATAALSLRVEAARAGATLLLNKPIATHVLAHSLRRLFARPLATRRRCVVFTQDDTLRLTLEDWSGELALDLETESSFEQLLLAGAAQTAPALYVIDPGAVLSLGLDVVRTLRLDPALSDVPIVMLLDTLADEGRWKAIRAGATDVLTKPMAKPDWLGLVEARVFRDVTPHCDSERDPISGLLKRPAFLEQFAQRVAESQRYQRPLSLLSLQVRSDGSDASEPHELLASTAHTLRSTFRVEDLCGQWDDSVFVIALPAQDKKASERAFERLSEALHRSVKRTSRLLSYQLGIATSPDDGQTSTVLLNTSELRRKAAALRWLRP